MNAMSNRLREIAPNCHKHFYSDAEWDALYMFVGMGEWFSDMPHKQGSWFLLLVAEALETA